MQAFLDKASAHLTAWKLEYIAGACYVAGYFHLVGKIFRALGKYAG